MFQRLGMPAVITATKSSEDMSLRCCNTGASELPSAARSLNTGVSVLIRGVRSEMNSYATLLFHTISSHNHCVTHHQRSLPPFRSVKQDISGLATSQAPPPCDFSTHLHQVSSKIFFLAENQSNLELYPPSITSVLQF